MVLCGSRIVIREILPLFFLVLLVSVFVPTGLAYGDRIPDAENDNCMSVVTNSTAKIGATTLTQLSRKKSQIINGEVFLEIYTAEDLDDIRNNLSANYILMSDIDLSNWGSWSPIGMDGEGLSGIFLGNNHTISGLQIHETIESNDHYSKKMYYGLFQKCSHIENLSLTNVDIDLTINAEVKIGIGSLAGYGYGAGINSLYPEAVKNCSAEGSISLSGKVRAEYVPFSDRGLSIGIGGLVAQCYGSVSDSSNQVEISSRLQIE